MSSSYQDAIEYVAAYNSTLAAERRRRPDHWDAYTSVRQRPCKLWQRESDRKLCSAGGRVYTYAARRWKVRKGWTQGTVKEPPARRVAEPAPAKSANPYQTRSADRPRTIYVEENTSDESDGDGMEVRSFSDGDVMHEDSSDGEVAQRSSRRSSRRQGVGIGGTPRPAPDEKPLNCNMCGKICKNMNGLLHHLNANPNHRKAHPELEPTVNEASSHEATPSLHGDEEAVVPDRADSRKVEPNNYCDFCLGTAAENKKTKLAEILVSCGDCGRSGHPSCLQFTSDLVANVLRYHWQCIECKSCGVCGSSDNDDQLLFCDDCDRGYHMFCLAPPISEPPEGKWTCVICVGQSTSSSSAGHSRKRGRRKRR